MNMRKIIAVLAAVLMLCAAIPMAAISVSAAPGDVIINKNFDDGSYFSNGSNENGYMVFDATTANWANVYMYANAIKSGTKYELTFDAKANKATNMNVKINNNWGGDTFKWTTNVTTEWATYTTVINPDELATLTSTALLMFTSNTYAADGAVYHIDNVVVKEYLDPSIIGTVLNGDFETGDKSNWSGSATVVAEGYNGGYAAKLSNPGQWSSALTQTIPVEANTVYEITWMSKRLSGSGAFNLIACQSVSPYTNYTKVAGQNWMNETSGNWVNNSFTINTGDNTSMLLKFTTEATNPGEILLDNIKVSKVKDPSFDGYITNGDFETGKTTPWDKYSSTAVTAEAAKDGDYGMMLSGGGASYGGIANQNFTVIPGKTYTVRFDLKVVNAGVNVQIKDNGANVAGGYLSKTEWTTYTYDFTPNYANANLNFCGSGIAGTDVAYLDNVMVYEKVEESNDGYIKNGTLDTGNSNRWSLIWSNQVAASVITGGKDSTFAVQVSGKDTQVWGQFRQSVAVEPNTDYKVTVWAKNSSGMSLLVKTGDDSANINNVGANAGEEWTQITNEFNSGNNTSILVGIMVNVAGASGIFDTFVMEKLHTCSHVETSRTDATCGADGSVTYTCSCGDSYTETLPATGEHVYFDDCSAICEVCGYEREAGHNVIHVEAKAATCTEMGNIEYWYCDVCGMAWLDEAGTMNTNLRAVNLPMAEHTYFDDCSAICEVCGFEREASHNVVHVAAKAATCTEMGNIEYWYCDVCGMAWLDAECTLNTNQFAVKLPVAEHTYDNEFDADCNGCGAIREVAAFPVPEIGKSISEDVSGYAVLFDANVEGLELVDGAADYTNATYNGYKLLGLGVTASNSKSSVNIAGVRVYGINDETGALQFAFRVINIPEASFDADITMVPYYTVEIDGVVTTIEGEAVVGSYNEIAG